VVRITIPSLRPLQKEETQKMKARGEEDSREIKSLSFPSPVVTPMSPLSFPRELAP